MYFFVFSKPVFSRLTFRVVMYLSLGRQIFRECRVEQDRLCERLFTIASHSTIAFIQIQILIFIQRKYKY